MSIFKAVKLKIGKRKRANLSGIIKYVLKDEKTEEKLIYGQCLEIERAYKMMIETKETFNKLDGREYFHFVQSYAPTENITPSQALVQAKKLLEESKKFRPYEILVAVHKDRAHIHVHFIVNSVSFVDGKKFHLTKKELEEIKKLQNEINIRDGYQAAPEKGYTAKGEKRVEKVVNEKNTYQLLSRAEKGEVDSYVLNCALEVLKNSKKALSKEHFIKLMESKGFETTWAENKKHITFTDIERQKAGERKCKIRLSKLADYYPEFENLATKEQLLNDFERNSRQAEQTADLAGIREQLDRNREKLSNQGAAIADRSIQITERNSQLSDNGAGIANISAELSSNKEQLSNQRDEIADRNLQITKRNSELAAGNAEIADNRLELTNRKEGYSNIRAENFNIATRGNAQIAQRQQLDNAKRERETVRIKPKGRGRAITKTDNDIEW